MNEASWEWRYLPTGRMRHAMQGPLSLVPPRRAVCGVETWTPDGWMGTGSQVEYERVSELPPCRRCLRAMS